MKLDKILTIIFGVMIIVVVSLLFVLLKSRSNIPSPSLAPDVQNYTQAPEKDKPFEVPFDYVVTKITTSQIFLEGKNGEISVPQDPDKVTVFFQEGDQTIPASLTDAQIGLEANLTINPGVSAELYLIPNKK